MEPFIAEIRAVAESIFLGGDWIFLGMVIVAALVGVAAMKNVGQIICTSVLAMIVLGVILLIYGGVQSEAPTDPASYLSTFTDGWAALADMPGSKLISYLITFAVAIIVLFLGKSLIFRD